MRKTWKSITASLLAIGLLLSLPLNVAANNAITLNSSPNKRIEYTHQASGEKIIIDTADIHLLGTEVANLKNAMDAFTVVPASTYYYVVGTEGDAGTIKRYVFENGQYFPCNENGTKIGGAESPDPGTLREYTGITAANLSAGSAGFINKTMVLGNGSDNADYYERGISEMKNNGYRKVVDLGVGTSFNVTQYEGWESFTIDNFIIESVDGTLSAAGSNPNSYGYHIDGTASTTLYKQYSNGVFTAYNTFTLSGRAYYEPTSTTVARMTSTENLAVHVFLLY